LTGASRAGRQQKVVDDRIRIINDFLFWLCSRSLCELYFVAEVIRIVELTHRE
jgi:hypothetical protein